MYSISLFTNEHLFICELPFHLLSMYNIGFSNYCLHNILSRLLTRQLVHLLLYYSIWRI